MSAETINILFLIMTFIGVAALLIGRYLLPDNFWLAIYVCAVLGPFGHFYIRYGFPYFFAVVMVGFGVQTFGMDSHFAQLATYLSSIFFMILRFKVASIRQIEQKKLTNQW